MAKRLIKPLTTIQAMYYTRSPYAHCMSCLTQYGRRDLQWDTGGVHKTRYSNHYLLTYLFIYIWIKRRMDISWTDHVRNEEVLPRVKEQRNILHEISKRKAKWTGHIVRRNRLLQQVTEGKIKGGIVVTGTRGRRRRKLLADVKERRGYSHLKEEALDRSIATSRIRNSANWPVGCERK
jgi:hypothetical protein